MPLRRMLAIVAGLYLIEGFPMGVFHLVLPQWWTEIGLSKASIGALSGLGMAWTAKALWSPLVQWRGDYRTWISGALVVMGAALMALPVSDPTTGAFMSILVGAFCVASATQDIAIDAATIGIVPRGDEGPANSMRVGAYRVAMATFGTGSLFLPGWIGWENTLRILGVVPLLMAAGVWLTPRAAAGGTRRPDLLRAFAGWRARREIWAIAGFVLLFRLSDFAMGPMLVPFQNEAGLDREEIGILGGIVGGILVVAGAGIGGALAHARGIPVALLWTGILAVASNLVYAGAAIPGMGTTAVVVASIGESLTTGMVTAAFMSFLMRICEREWAAIQYATLTGLYAFVGRLVGSASGFVTEEVGFAGYFALTAALTLPSFALLPAVRRWVEAAAGDDADPSIPS